MRRIPLLVAAVALALPGGVAAQAGIEVDVDIGGIAPEDVSGPLRLSADGYGAGVAIDQEGTTHVGWLERRPDGRDVVRYCRVERPGTACGDQETFELPGVSQRGQGRLPGDPPVRVISPRPDLVVVVTHRSARPNEEIVASSEGRPILPASCGSCPRLRRPVVAEVSRDAGRTFEQFLLGDAATAEAATALTLNPGAPEEETRIATFGSLLDIMTARVPPPFEYFGGANNGGVLDEGGGADGGPGRGDAALSVEEPVIAALAEQPIVAGEGTFTDGQCPSSEVSIKPLYARRFTARPNAKETEIVDKRNWQDWERIGCGASLRMAAVGGRVKVLTQDLRRSRQGGWEARDITTPAAAPPSQSLGGTFGSRWAPRSKDSGDIASDGVNRFGAAWIEPTKISGSGGSERLRQYALRYSRSDANGKFATPVNLVAFSHSGIQNGAERVEDVNLAITDDGGSAVVLQRRSADDGAAPAAIELVIAGSRAPRPFDDVRVTGAEITQGVQNSAPLVRSRVRPESSLYYLTPGREDATLVRAKPTFVRVYASTRRTLAGAQPPMSLRVFRNRKLLTTVMPTPPTAGLPVGDAFTVPDGQHTGTTQVYTFVLPPVNDNASYTYDAQINPPGVMPGLAECGQCRGTDNLLKLGPAEFDPTTTVDILPIELHAGDQSVAARRPLAAATGPNTVFARAAVALPVQLGVRPWVGSIDVAAIAVADQSPDVRQTEALDSVEWWSDETDNEQSNRFPIGVFPYNANNFGYSVPQRAGDGRWMRSGKFYNAEYLDPASCWFDDCTQSLYGDRQPIAILADNQNRDLNTIAHEITHGLGFAHAGTDRGCYTEEDQVGEDWPFGADGKMNGIGLDTIGQAPPFTRVVSDPSSPSTTVYDFMSYCFNRSSQPRTNWVSLLSWNRISAFFAPPRGKRRSTSVHAAGAGEKSLVVAASVPRDGGAGRVVRVRPDDHDPVPITAVRNPGPYVLIARDAAGAEIFRAALERKSTAEEGARLDALRGWVPRAGVTQVEVVRAATGTPVAARAASPGKPKVRITTPRRGDTIGGRGKVQLRWSASDPDGDPLETRIEYAADGRTFRAVALESQDQRTTLPARLFPRAGKARLRVRVGDGFNEASAVAGPVRSLGAPPEIEVLDPTVTSGMRADASLLLRAVAHDDEGRKLSDRNIRWFAGREVVARRGEALALLPAGRVKLTAEARDRSGRVARRTVTIDVAPAKPRFVRLSGPRRVSLRARTVTLRVATTFPSTFVIARRRFAVGPGARSITLRLPKGRRAVEFPATLRSGPEVTTTRVTVVRR